MKGMQAGATLGVFPSGMTAGRRGQGVVNSVVYDFLGVGA